MTCQRRDSSKELAMVPRPKTDSCRPPRREMCFFFEVDRVEEMGVSAMGTPR